jgi:4-amino-4-deoxy-L-arabinose transferase-like glycosyltransferase
VITTPSPALVTQRAAQRLPRPVLWLLCAAYVLTGLFGRDPWGYADLTAFGHMVAMAEGRTPWLAPTLGGLPLDSALLPHWLGAVFIAVLSPWIEPAFAARIPFALLLALTLMLTWYTTFHLARTEAAQPVAFAFGGEASTVDYARAMADGGLLALMATLGLLQLGHETTPELAQLGTVALFLWGLAAAPYRGLRPRLAVLAALPLLAACGAPMFALSIGAVGSIVCLRSRYDSVRPLARWILGATLIAAAAAAALHTWRWRVGFAPTGAQLLQLTRLFLWFLWPVWLLALWTLWRWRHHLLHRHLSVPLCVAATALVACGVTGGSDRVLMLGLPGFAVLAAFSLPTLQRGTRAAIDWFSVFFFTACAIGIWVVYAAMQTGVPAKTAANVVKLVPGFVPRFSLPALLFAVLATLAWLWLVRWRTGRHQHALWKSLVLPASGVALAWVLLFTLWLPLLDYERSYRPWVENVLRYAPPGACVATQGYARPAVAALEHFGARRVDAREGAAQRSTCAILLIAETRRKPAPVPAGWTLIVRERRPADREDSTAILRRAGP